MNELYEVTCPTTDLKWEVSACTVHAALEVLSRESVGVWAGSSVAVLANHWKLEGSGREPAEEIQLNFISLP